MRALFRLLWIEMWRCLCEAFDILTYSRLQEGGTKVLGSNQAILINVRTHLLGL